MIKYVYETSNVFAFHFTFRYSGILGVNANRYCIQIDTGHQLSARFYHFRGGRNSIALETFHKEITKIMLIYTTLVSIIIDAIHLHSIILCFRFGLWGEKANHDINSERIPQENGQ